MYQTAWETLKKSPTLTVKIAADPAVHDRIYKAIRKEKDQDLVYKMQMADDGKSARLASSVEGSTLILSLVIKESYANYSKENLGL